MPKALRQADEAGQDHVAKACLESMLLHARNLVEFLIESLIADGRLKAANIDGRRLIHRDETRGERGEAVMMRERVVPSSSRACDRDQDRNERLIDAYAAAESRCDQLAHDQECRFAAFEGAPCGRRHDFRLGRLHGHGLAHAIRIERRRGDPREHPNGTTLRGAIVSDGT
jgi:hypothetical protein